MTYDAKEGSDQGAFGIDRHRITYTIFPNNLAKKKTEIAETLPQLHARIVQTIAQVKDRLPLLKLARFGNVCTDKGCLRHDTNMQDVYGIEIEHDAGAISFAVAVATLRAANLRAIVYTTPSHSEAQPRWRALLPLSEPIGRDERGELVGRANGLFAGGIAAESFRRSQAFYFGKIDGAPFESDIIDGDFIDLADDIKAAPPAKAGSTGTAHVTVFAALTVEELVAHFERRLGDGDLAWHDPMISLSAKLAGAGKPREEIEALLAKYSDGGADDRQMLDIVDSAMRKFAPKPMPNMAVLASVLKTAKGQRPAVLDRPGQPDMGATLEAKAEWLVQCFGWCAAENRVIDLFSESAGHIVLGAFREQWCHWGERRNVDGRNKRVTATSLWSVSPARAQVAGARMAPGKAFPLFAGDDGLTCKNTYRPPRHTGSGEIDTWLAFMAHLLPDPAERNWFCNWLAHKWQHPAIPGVGVIMVAADDDGPIFGAGRGMLRDVLGRLLGRKYVRAIAYDVFTGISSQGIYDDWAAYSLLVVVNEAKDTADSSRYRVRSAIEERMREIIDPRPIERMFTPKGTPAFTATAHASYLICSNNFDALSLPAGDRRITVLRNGGAMAPAMAERLQAWMDDEGNIAELARWLEARDLTGFNAYAPLDTQAKRTMQELARDEIDDALLEIRREIGPNSLFTTEMVLAEVRQRIGEVHPDDRTLWRVKQFVRASAKRVQDYRMVPSEGRMWVLAWRDADISHLASVELARVAVRSTLKRLAG